MPARAGRYMIVQWGRRFCPDREWPMKIPILALALGLAAPDPASAETLHMRCGNFHYFTGSGAPDPRDYVDITIAPRVRGTSPTRWPTAPVHSRNDQYALANRTTENDITWGGYFNKNPKLYIAVTASLWIDDQKRLTYSEKLIDRSLGDKTVLDQSSLCELDGQASTTAAIAPAAAATGKLDADVGIAKNLQQGPGLCPGRRGLTANGHADRHGRVKHADRADDGPKARQRWRGRI